MTIWTVGHSNHTMERFLELLRAAQIDTLADVRSSPYARYATHFTHDVLREAVEQAGVAYVYLGDSLGGRPRDPSLLGPDAKPDYARIAATPAFAEGIARLMALSETHRVAIMCGEESPASCHRRRLVGRELQRRGVEVLHIRGDVRVQTERDLLDEETAASGGQLSLFADDDA